MKTITATLLNRLDAEAEEADVLGLHSIAQNLTRQIEKTATRLDTADYEYPVKEFEQDIQDLLWSAVIRTADFYNCNVNSVECNKLVVRAAQELASGVFNQSGLHSSVGAYEEPILGQDEDISIEE